MYMYLSREFLFDCLYVKQIIIVNYKKKVNKRKEWKAVGEEEAEKIRWYRSVKIKNGSGKSQGIFF